MQITWLGQGGFLFEADGFRLVVDAYLSDALAGRGFPRLVSPPLPVETLAPSVVFCTHDHADHLDPQSVMLLADAYPDCTFLGPESVVRHCQELGISPERCRSIAPGQALACGPFALTAMEAHHSDPCAVGLLIETGGVKIYLSGDTEFDSNLAASVLQFSGRSPDIVIICINGRWGNMNADDALKVVGELGPSVAVPMHYGLFAQNTADPQPFAEGCGARGVCPCLLDVGVAVDTAALLGNAG